MLVVAALLLVAIIVISNQDAQEVTTSVLQVRNKNTKRETTLLVA